MSNASEALVDLYCKELRLPGLRRAYRDIAREALAQGRTPVDFLAACLAQELLQAEQEYRLPRYLKGWQKVDLVIADELGYINLGPGAPLLFQFCAARYERGSMVITTNLEFSRWTEVLRTCHLDGCAPGPAHPPRAHPAL